MSCADCEANGCAQHSEIIAPFNKRISELEAQLETAIVALQGFAECDVVGVERLAQSALDVIGVKR